MSEYRAPLDSLRFLLFDVFDMPRFWRELGLEAADADTASAILEEAGKICEQVLAPLDASGDEEGCTWSAEGVVSPAGFKDAYQTFCEGGWGALGGDPEFEGMGMPKSLVSAVEEMVQGANMAFGLAPMLTAGACLAINAHASTALKQQYLPKMYSGDWAGAMDLTEPHAGTDLGMIRTKAEPDGNGAFRISGTKIFITWGEHDMAENIVHLVLAKTPDAPAGTRGISLFLVPKFLPNEDGSLGPRNQLSCGSIEKKMGIKGSATCVMNFDSAIGWLVGEENAGLAAMFTMMNYERLVVGIQGLGVADASYQTALDYAKERIQGRSPSGPKSPDKAADSLLVHPDVRRMLMDMKVFNEAGRAFYLYVARWLDQAKYAEDNQQIEKAEAMVALLTPVAKSFITDKSFDACVLGQQVLGGHGFIREWGQEQHVRDVRITQIYEGTNGVQAMDLIGRKTIAQNGQLLTLFIGEIREFLSRVERDECKAMCSELESYCADFESLTADLCERAGSDPELAGSVAVDYQEALGILAYGYMWLQMANKNEQSPAASALACAEYFFERHLIRMRVLQTRIALGSSTVMALQDEQF